MPTRCRTARPATSWSRPAAPRWARASTRLTAGGFPYLVAEEDGAVARLCLCRAVPAAPGLSLHRRGFDLCRAGGQGPGASACCCCERLIDEPRGSWASARSSRSSATAAPTAPRCGCTKGSAFAIRAARRIRLQARPLAGHGVHAACAERRRRGAARSGIRCRSGRFRAERQAVAAASTCLRPVDQLQLLVEDAEHAGQVRGRA